MQRESTGERRAIDTMGHGLAVVATLVVWAIAHLHGVWRPWTGGVVTLEWPQTLWAVDLSMATAVVGHLVLAVWRPAPVRRAVDLATAVTGLVLIVVTLGVWPFAFSLVFAGADALLLAVLWIAVFGVSIAVVVNALLLLASPWVREPGHAGGALEPRDVLVTYASKHGATEDIALHIANALGNAGLSVDLLPVDEAPPPHSYRAVVLGSAVYYGMWRADAARWLRANEAALSTRPVWLFSSGPTGTNPPADLATWRFPENLKAVAARVHPRDTVVFGGALDPAELGWFERFVIGRVGAPMGDFRDWDAIGRWAASIALELKPPVARTDQAA